MNRTNRIPAERSLPRRPLARALSGAALSGALVGLAFAGGVMAQGNMATPAPATGAAAGKPSSSLAAGDRRFITNAAEGGMAEVALGQVAKDKASDPAVKAFGERMVKDHGAANEELAKLAASKGVEGPQKLSSSHQRAVDRMSKMSGAEFDRAYMKDMAADHRKDVSDFEKASKDAKDADVKAFAAKTLPVLKEHKQMADELNGRMSASRTRTPTAANAK